MSDLVIQGLLCIPFAGMLLSIAIFPLVKGEWWEHKRHLVVIFWSVLLLIPFTLYYGFNMSLEHVLEVIFGDYITFIVLLFGLFAVCGNISIKTNLDGSPKFNALLLLIGALLASWIGTTGASMVMIRPLLRANHWRKRKVQTFVFFIFMVSNIGGALTPIGDPPLLMGFMRGIPFFWSLKIFPIMAMNIAILLALYYYLDRKAFTKDMAEGLHPEFVSETSMLKVSGAKNIVLLLVIVLAVILSGALPESGLMSGSFHIYGEVHFNYASLLEVVLILAAAAISFKTTTKEVRDDNDFNWEPIKEVAVLFIGIFITMIPALMLLHENGAKMNITEPWQMFWATGILSSFLDNTPTYLVFLTTAGTLGATSGVATTAGIIAEKTLLAISCGAVFMGANTYIGNAPNFMVKAIAENQGIKMPSFFGYMMWSMGYLLPIFVLDMFIFFR